MSTQATEQHEQAAEQYGHAAWHDQEAAAYHKAQTQHLNHEPPTAWNTLSSNGL